MTTYMLEKLFSNNIKFYFYTPKTFLETKIPKKISTIWLKMAKTDNKQKGEKVDRLGAKIKSAKEHVANKTPQDAKVDTTKSSWDHANMDLQRVSTVEYSTLK